LTHFYSNIQRNACGARHATEFGLSKKANEIFEKSNSPVVLIKSQKDLHNVRSPTLVCKFSVDFFDHGYVPIKHQLSKLLNMMKQVSIEAMFKKCIPSTSEYATIARLGSE
jgi:hypothetical protein